LDRRAATCALAAARTPPYLAAMLTALANPHRFMAVSGPLAPALGLAAAALALAGLWLGFTAPEDYQQGDTVRIMFVHVPAAWLSLFAYACLGGASLSALVWRHALADAAARAAAPLGAGFTLLALATGALWGRPMWGTWWEWDARMTSVLVLFLFYLGYMALRASIDDEAKAGRAAAILALVGLVNLPIVKFSVDWWNTLHQPASVLRADGPSMPPAYLTPLLLMALAYTCAFLALWMLRTRAEVWRRRAGSLQALAAAHD
jgi:heme exporter protein C